MRPSHPVQRLGDVREIERSVDTPCQERTSRQRQWDQKENNSPDCADAADEPVSEKKQNCDCREIKKRRRHDLTYGCRSVFVATTTHDLIDLIGAGYGIRTCDPLLVREMLYR